MERSGQKDKVADQVVDVELSAADGALLGGGEFGDDLVVSDVDAELIAAPATGAVRFEPLSQPFALVSLRALDELGRQVLPGHAHVVEA